MYVQFSRYHLKIKRQICRHFYYIYTKQYNMIWKFEYEFDQAILLLTSNKIWRSRTKNTLFQLHHFTGRAKLTNKLGRLYPSSMPSEEKMMYRLQQSWMDFVKFPCNMSLQNHIIWYISCFFSLFMWFCLVHPDYDSMFVCLFTLLYIVYRKVIQYLYVVYQNFHCHI